MLQNIDKDQLLVLREIALNTRFDNIELNDDTLDFLKRYSTFIRKLSHGSVSKRMLSVNYKVVSEMIRIALQHHAICEQDGVSSYSGMEYDEEKRESREPDQQ
jgi:hypothetical protein